MRTDLIRLDLRDLLPPAEVLGEGAWLIGVAGDLGQRAGPGQHRVDRRGRGLPRAEDLPDANDAIPGESRHGFLIGKQRRDLRSPAPSGPHNA